MALVARKKPEEMSSAELDEMLRWHSSRMKYLGYLKSLLEG